MNNNNTLPWYYSVWAIVIAFLIFWPLGIVLLILRGKNSKQSVFLGSTDKKIYIIGGIVMIIIGFSTMSSDTTVGIFLLVGGVALIGYAEKLKKKAERNRKYIDLIVNQGQTSLDNIANMCNINYDLVVKELRTMISLGVLKNAVVDESMRTISIQKAQAQAPAYGLQDTVASFIGSVAGAAEQPVEEVICTCPGCGAKVALRKGTSQNCEYCDSPIAAK